MPLAARIDSVSIALLTSVVITGCDGSTGPGTCAVEFSGEVCLDLSAAGGLTDFRDVFEVEIGEALNVVQPLIGPTDVRIAIIADPAGVIPEVGLGGFNPGPDDVQIFADPGWPDLEIVLRVHLQPMLAHELHHAMRRRAIGYGSTLLQAAVSEGLADHFSAEAFPGYAPPWASALTDSELSTWTPEVVARASGSYDHAEWFFGAGSVPRWTGYSVGHELVANYLAANSTELASNLVGEPAASFIP